MWSPQDTCWEELHLAPPLSRERKQLPPCPPTAVSALRPSRAWGARVSRSPLGARVTEEGLPREPLGLSLTRVMGRGLQGAGLGPTSWQMAQACQPAPTLAGFSLSCSKLRFCRVLALNAARGRHTPSTGAHSRARITPSHPLSSHCLQPWVSSSNLRRSEEPAPRAVQGDARR